ncbi:MAG: FG-GAP-like repeat-containing protein [Planctomycetota bacterium]
MYRIPTLLGLACLAAPLAAQSGGATRIVDKVLGASERYHLGSQMVVIGDVTGDGIPDYAAAADLTGAGSPGDHDTVYLHSGADGSLLFTWMEHTGVEQFGSAIAAAGDVNADGFPDIVVGAQNAEVNGLPFYGAAYVYSGADGTELYRFDGQEEGSSFGYSVAGAGDYNADGFDDIIVGAPDEDYFFGLHEDAGAVYVYSGFDGSLLALYRGNAFDEMGSSVAGAGDLNGDGHDDVLIAAAGFAIPGSYGSGAVFAYSGASRSLLHAFIHGFTEDFFGQQVKSMADIDGDGVREILISSSPSQDAIVHLYSGSSGQQLHAFQEVETSSAFGSTTADAGDVDGDGVHDILIGARFQQSPLGPEVGAVFLHSGADFHRIATLTGTEANQWFGGSVSGLGDRDGDGRDEFLIAVTNADTVNGRNSGLVQTYTFDPFLMAGDTQLSMSGATSLDLELDFPVEEAGRTYRVLASLRGTTPDLLHGVSIPLEQDAVFQSLLQSSAISGNLDANGDASHSLVSPRVVPGLIGRDLHFAAVSFDPVTGTASLSSVARTVELTP